jgi:hypothetical protein
LELVINGSLSATYSYLVHRHFVAEHSRRQSRVALSLVPSGSGSQRAETSFHHSSRRKPIVISTVHLQKTRLDYEISGRMPLCYNYVRMAWYGSFGPNLFSAFPPAATYLIMCHQLLVHRTQQFDSVPYVSVTQRASHPVPLSPLLEYLSLYLRCEMRLCSHNKPPILATFTFTQVSISLPTT